MVLPLSRSDVKRSNQTRCEHFEVIHKKFLILRGYKAKVHSYERALAYDKSECLVNRRCQHLSTILAK